MIINKSLCVIPGPPFRGILSPPATSITYNVKSANSFENAAAKLSPPDSHNINGGKLGLELLPSNNTSFVKSSHAVKFADTSSRIAACGQPPVSTALIYLASNAS